MVAKFYVFKGKSIIRNILLLAIVILALVYVFSEGEVGENNQPPHPPEENNTSPVMASVQDSPLEFMELAEYVTVRPVPTKFSEYRLERERVRSREMELLESIAYDTSVSEEKRSTAQQELQNLIGLMTREKEIENLLRAKGYLDGVVILTDSSITVVVPAALSSEEAAGIGELVNRITGIRLDRITIVDEPLIA